MKVLETVSLAASFEGAVESLPDWKGHVAVDQSSSRITISAWKIGAAPALLPSLVAPDALEKGELNDGLRALFALGTKPGIPEEAMNADFLEADVLGDFEGLPQPHVSATHPRRFVILNIDNGDDGGDTSHKTHKQGLEILGALPGGGVHGVGPGHVHVPLGVGGEVVLPVGPGGLTGKGNH
ncbi:MAG: hypothetical protein QM820_45730 [Minicystis sp.]